MWLTWVSRLIQLESSQVAAWIHSRDLFQRGKKRKMYQPDDEYDEVASDADLLVDDVDEDHAAYLHHQLMQQRILLQHLEAVPELVRNFIAYLHRMLAERPSSPSQQQQHTTELQTLYEQTWPKLTEKYYQDTPWPEPEVIAPLANHDELFLVLYRELYFRHIYDKLQPSLEHRFLSFENYCTLFNTILNAEEPVDMELPNPWLWDIVDEFVYQYQSYCRYRDQVAKLRQQHLQTNNQVPEEITEVCSLLHTNPQIWNTYSVLNVLYSLREKVSMNEQLRVMQAGGDLNAAAEAVGNAFAGKTLYRMLGYFSMVSLVRIHCLFGDYMSALDHMKYVDLVKKVLRLRLFSR